MTSLVARDDGVSKEATWLGGSLGRSAGVLNAQIHSDDGGVPSPSLPTRCPSMTSPLGKMITPQTRVAVLILR